MSQEPDMSFLIEQARMFLTVRSTVLYSVANVTFQYHYTINCYLDIISVCNNLFLIPFTDRLKRFVVIGIRRDDAINRTCLLYTSRCV